MAEFRVRPAAEADPAFLREMLLCAGFPPGSATPPVASVLDDKRLARYVADWGRPGIPA